MWSEDTWLQEHAGETLTNEDGSAVKAIEVVNIKFINSHFCLFSYYCSIEIVKVLFIEFSHMKIFPHDFIVEVFNLTNLSKNTFLYSHFS